MKTAFNPLRLCMIVAAAVSLTACVMPRMDDPMYAPPPPAVPVYAPAEDGTIYSSGTDLRLFEDLKAGRVGDILTVKLVEKTNASKNSQTSTQKTTEATLANPTIFGRPITKKRRAAVRG